MGNMKDKIWLLGETPGFHHKVAHYRLPGENTMTPMEGLEFFGVKNLCRMKMKSDAGLRYENDPYIVGDYMEKLSLTLVGSGEIEGAMLHSSNNADLGLSATDISKAWVDALG